MIQIGMEMPTKCSECRMRTDYDYCSAMPKNYCGNTEDEGRPDWCPLHEVPDNGGWISVKDRLPENELIVIGYTPVDGYMFIGFHRTHVAYGYDWSAWYIVTAMRSTKKITKKVTHWMPLPEPPKED